MSTFVSNLVHFDWGTAKWRSAARRSVRRAGPPGLGNVMVAWTTT